MKEVPLTKGKVALVDDEDFDLVSQYKWCACKNKKDTTWYARSVIRDNSGKIITISMHRLIMNANPEQLVDHIDGDGLNNRRLTNLRCCTDSENQHNMHARWGKSRYKGVYYHRQAGKWHARISVNKKRISLGYYHDEVLAAIAYDEAARKMFGDFANTNFLLKGVI